MRGLCGLDLCTDNVHLVHFRSKVHFYVHFVTCNAAIVGNTGVTVWRSTERWVSTIGGSAAAQRWRSPNVVHLGVMAPHPTRLQKKVPWA